MLHHLRQAREAEAASKQDKRQSLAGSGVDTVMGTVGTLGHDAKGLLGNFAAVVDAANYFRWRTTLTFATSRSRRSSA